MGSFVGEALRPVAGSGRAAATEPGAPVLPGAFRWRDAEHRVAAVLAAWRDAGPCRSGSEERYVRKHWYRLRTAEGAVWRVYCERRARCARQATKRWWLFCVEG